MRKLNFALIIIMISGCSLLKQTSKTRDEAYNELHAESSYSALGESQLIKTGKEVFYKQDSSEGAYVIRLWPRGMVNLTKDGIFTGILDSVVMTGKLKKVSNVADVNQTNEQKLEKTGIKTGQKSDHQSQETKVTKLHTPDGKVILCVLTIVAILIFLIKKWRFWG